MDIVERWEKALKKTEIVRPRVKPLLTFDTTELPYIFLAESALNYGDCVVRKGKILAEKPQIVLPENLPQFEGFDFEKEPEINQDTVINFLLVRGVRFPSYKYNNKTSSLDIFEGSLSKAVNHFKRQLQRKEDVHAGLVIGPEDCWQFSAMIFICTMIARSAEKDVKNILEDFERRRHLS